MQEALPRVTARLKMHARTTAAATWRSEVSELARRIFGPGEGAPDVFNCEVLLSARSGFPGAIPES